MLALACREIASGEGHAAGRALLAQLYRAQTGEALPPIVRQPGGKPVFARGSYHFSISHTRCHVYCALSDHPIGIDAEEADRDINLRLAEKILSPAEYARWQAFPDPREGLLRLWVLKEAAAKHTGEGIRGYPNKTDFSPHDPRIQRHNTCLLAIIE